MSIQLLSRLISSYKFRTALVTCCCTRNHEITSISVITSHNPHQGSGRLQFTKSILKLGSSRIIILILEVIYTKRRHINRNVLASFVQLTYCKFNIQIIRLIHQFREVCLLYCTACQTRYKYQSLHNRHYNFLNTYKFLFHKYNPPVKKLYLLKSSLSRNSFKLYL